MTKYTSVFDAILGV